MESCARPRETEAAQLLPSRAATGDRGAGRKRRALGLALHGLRARAPTDRRGRIVGIRHGAGEKETPRGAGSFAKECRPGRGIGTRRWSTPPPGTAPMTMAAAAEHVRGLGAIEVHACAVDVAGAATEESWETFTCFEHEVVSSVSPQLLYLHRRPASTGSPAGARWREPA